MTPCEFGDYSQSVCGHYKVTIISASVVDQYPLPKPEDLMAQLAGRQKFPKLDLSHINQQILLNSDSWKFVIINSQLGLFQIPDSESAIQHSICSLIVSENNGYSVILYSEYTLLLRRHIDH